MSRIRFWLVTEGVFHSVIDLGCLDCAIYFINLEYIDRSSSGSNTGLPISDFFRDIPTSPGWMKSFQRGFFQNFRYHPCYVCHYHCPNVIEGGWGEVI